MSRWLLMPLVVCPAALLASAALFLAVEHRRTPEAPDFRVVHVGGLEYEYMQARPVDPANRIDARIAAGLPARGRDLPRRDILFGAFISVTNPSSRARPMAERIELRDQHGTVYRPLRLPAGNLFAYRARVLHPRTRIPEFGTAADDTLMATGRMLLFRIPRWQYRNAVLELVIHSPQDPADTASLVV
jgi:hypothetical protein